jgi:hypothetical protein
MLLCEMYSGIDQSIVDLSYQTPSGVVSGIQWVPAESTQVLPAGAQPANAVGIEADSRIV